MQVNQARTFMGRFELNSDLWLSLTEFAKKENIRLGQFSVIGALTEVKLGYYNQDERKYLDCINLNKKLEITSCIGNVSLKDSKIFVHAHITLADHQGHCYGGHLMPGSRIFAAEYFIKELIGVDRVELNRSHDLGTGLSLW